MILVARPTYEIQVRYVAAYLGQAVQELRRLGYRVTDLEGSQATADIFLDYLPQADYAVALGHGRDDTLTLTDYEPAITLSNAGVLAGKTFYAVSCRTARQLGRVAAENGCTYIGCNEDFVFLAQSPPLQNPLRDTLASRFLTPLVKIAVWIPVLGPREAVEKGRAMFLNNMKEALDRGETEAAKWLYWDANALTLVEPTESWAGIAVLAASTALIIYAAAKK